MVATESKAQPVVGYTPHEIQRIAHFCPADDLLYGGAAGGGKRLHVETPIPTAYGWVQMGALAPGDLVLTEQGKTTVVLAAYDVELATDCYRLTFDDGSTIDADAKHLWFTYTAADLAALTRRDPAWRAARRERRASRVGGNKSEAFTAAITARNQANPPATLPLPTGAVRTTAEIAATLRIGKRSNHAIPVTEPVDLPDRDLPLDPYLFGLWLGDGHTGVGRITSADDEIVNAFRAAGFKVVSGGRYEYRIHGLIQILRSMYAHDFKHVPLFYLRGSRAQRLALLQGLMDTDGCVTQNGSVEFTTTSRGLADGVHELASSLGHKVTIHTGRATLYGKDCGPKYRLKWTPPECVFRLTRKREKQKIATSRRTKFRYIVSCERIGPTPMRCIIVDNPTGLFLAGTSFIPTHNSAFLVNDAIISSFQPWPHAQSSVLFRRTNPELQELEDYSQELLSGTGLGKYNQNDQRWTFANGATLKFSGLQYFQDVYGHKSFEYDWIGFDEAGDFMPGQLEYLVSRNRVRVGNWARMRFATNPGGVAHVWLKDRFITPTQDGLYLENVELLYYWDATATNPVDGQPGAFRRYPPGTMGPVNLPRYDVWLPPLTQQMVAENEAVVAKGEEPLPRRSRCFIQALVTHNPHIDRGYRSSLLSLTDAAERSRLYLGDWSVFDGQYFRDFSPARHVIDPISPLPHWRKWISLDWGYTAPLCALWHALDPDTGRVITYRELYQTGLKDTEAAKLIMSLTPRIERIDGIWVDPSLKRGLSSDHAHSTIEVYIKAGLMPIFEAHNVRLTGWGIVRDFMADDPRTGTPRWQVTRNCVNLIRTLPTLVYDKNNPEDLDSDGEDHAADALRYGLVSTGTTAFTRRKGAGMGRWI